MRSARPLRLRPINNLLVQSKPASSILLGVSTTPPFSQPLGISPAKPMSFLSNLFSSSSSSASKSSSSNNMSFPTQKSDDEWRAVLSPEQFRILRQKGTEAAGTGDYNKHYPNQGVYNCAGCSAPLYKAATKFDSGCGWPAYFDSIPGAVKRNEDTTMGMTRIEIVCANCGGHLGHVFKGEKFDTPTDERHCVNSVSLKFKGEDGKE
ncbi:methionine-R-sulfoxide reductase-like protein SelR [Zalerion maritima]|uniref:Peptide-methionine (R)-S-oxide reductase n=1 Tax=Zalerion maritima TaxID=339359 RepID=A0AAD5RHT9_9PEZI|nr:methionine-R-sulfoxide reductase-like protein SelR [Zalerion maritima]